MIKGTANHDRLYEIAEAQAGHFTTGQARSAGYSRQLLGHHVKSANFVHEDHGIYRLARFPRSPREDLYVAWLRCGARAVVSHDSALDLYGLSDAIPSETHITIPRGASQRRAGIRLHTSALGPSEITSWQGLPVTTIERTIVDMAAGGAQEWILEQALREALGRGRTTITALIAQAERSRQPARGQVLGLVRGVAQP